MAVVLFDGVCNLCSASVQFIIRRDPGSFFKFASLQSEPGEQLKKEYGIDHNVQSMVLIEDGHSYTESTAALRIARHLHGPWKLLYIFIIVPKPLRNLVYRYIASHRYRWFGRKQSCMVPTPDMRKRFL